MKRTTSPPAATVERSPRRGITSCLILATGTRMIPYSPVQEFFAAGAFVESAAAAPRAKVAHSTPNQIVDSMEFLFQAGHGDFTPSNTGEFFTLSRFTF